MTSHRMRRLIVVAVLPALAAVLALLGSVATASAHGHTMVGDYQLVIGFHNEPAYQDEPNGLDLFVTNMKTQEKVNGLESTLQAEIIYGSSVRALTVKPQFGKDGAYTAYVLPTEAGNYTWHIFGSIRGTPCDVRMTSNPQTFSAVEAKSSVAFPSAEPTSADLKAQADAAARLGVIGVVAGVLGLLVGAAGLLVGLRRARTAAATGADARPANAPARAGV